MQSRMQPRLKCGIDSLTTLISRFGNLIALSINNIKIEIVLPADVPP